MNKYMRGFNNPTQIQSDIPLTDDQLMSVSPSIFQNGAHNSRSTRYCYIPTIEVIESLKKEGWEPFFAAQTKVRDESKIGFTKHMLRFRHAGCIGHDETNELILLNSHDGSSSYRLMSGIFRFVCANGLMTGNIFNDVRVHHKGDIVNDVLEGSYVVLDAFNKINEHKEAMKAINLTENESLAFGTAALSLRWGGHIPITAEQVTIPRRSEDNNTDLWTTFNVIQENVIQGGQRGKTKTGKNTKVRAVTGIDNNTTINKGLWILAEEMKKIKSSQI